jgi:hypothetical protein
MKNHLWRVAYSTRFSSSSGMERYHIDHKAEDVYVLTEAPSIPAISAEIKETLDYQTSLTSINKAEYLGTVLNACLGVCYCQSCQTGEEGLAIRNAEG